MKEKEEKATKKERDSLWRHARIFTPKYEDAVSLWEDATSYFEWCDSNPVESQKNMTKYQREGKGEIKDKKAQVESGETNRPYTIYGLCAFTGISSWSSFKSVYLSKPGFDDVITTIENIISSQQIDGAMTGLYKENLTSRMNGLAEMLQQNVNAEIDGTLEHKFTGFSFLPWTDGLSNSDKTKIACGEVIEELPAATDNAGQSVKQEPALPEPEPVFAEIVDISKSGVNG